MKQSIMTETRKVLWDAADIDENQLINLIDGMTAASTDFAELYFEASHAESWFLEDRIVKDATITSNRGVGVRAISGEKSGLAYVEEIAISSIENATKAAIAIANKQSSLEYIKVQNRNTPLPCYPSQHPFANFSAQQKKELLKSIDEKARQSDSRVTQVFATLIGSHRNMIVIASDGTLAADQRPLMRLNITVMVESNGRIERGSAGGGGRYDFNDFLRNGVVDQFIKQAIERALFNLDAAPSPAGTMDVVLGPGWPGILLHEAIGHGLEGDFHRKKTSAFTGKIGEKIASTQVTVVDDGTLKNRRGSLTIDDEGTTSQCTPLIENGVLTGLIQDKFNAKLMGTHSTGNGRRESFAHMPMPRMTNTYMLPGIHDPDEIIASVDRGIYASEFGGGQVDITNGKFVFSASQAFLIEKGKLTRPIRGSSLVGSGQDVLQRIAMVGNNLELDQGIGICGKDGQSVPVGVGQPTILVKEMTVGGSTIT